MPRLATVLSGTHEQVKSLIRDSENGLLSRFMFFCVNAIDEWLDGFDSYGGDKPLEESFDALGEEFSAFAKKLEDTPKILFKLSFPELTTYSFFFALDTATLIRLGSSENSLYLLSTVDKMITSSSRP